MNPPTSISLERSPRPRSLVVVLMILGFLGLAGLTVFVVERWRKALAMDLHAERLAAERRVLRQARPELSPAQAAALGRRIHELDARVAAAAGPWLPSAAAGDEDLFLRVANFVNAARARLSAAGIHLEVGERFGFADCLERPPPEAGWPRLRHDLALASTVLDALAAAAPSSLHHFQRGNCRRTAEAGAGARVSRAGPAGFSELVRLEVTFLGDTAALRRFVNALQSAEPRVWVETFEAEAAAPGPARGESTRFTVCIARPCGITNRPEVQP